MLLAAFCVSLFIFHILAAERELLTEVFSSYSMAKSMEAAALQPNEHGTVVPWDKHRLHVDTALGFCLISSDSLKKQ